MEEKLILKIDLDLKTKQITIKQLKERLKFLDHIRLLPKKLILKVELIKKKKYGAKIYLNKLPINSEQVLIIQAILGDDYKRLAISYRDYLLKIKHWNRLFLVKKYADGTFINAKICDVSKEVLNYVSKK